MKAVVYLGLVNSEEHPGCFGWGAHGYFYDDQPVAKHRTAYKATSKGYVLKSKDLDGEVNVTMYLDVYGALACNLPKGAALISAAIKTLDVFKEKGVSEIVVFSEGEFLVKITDRLEEQKKKDWMIAPGEKIKGWKIYNELYRAILSYPQGASFAQDIAEGILTKTKAYALASIAQKKSVLNQSYFSCTVTMPQSYWDEIEAENALIDQSGIFFNTLESKEFSQCYLLTNVKNEEDMIGDRSGKSVYGIVFPKVLDPIIEMIKNWHKKKTEDFGINIIINLSTVLNKRNYTLFSEYGEEILHQDRIDRIQASLPFSKQVSFEITPAQLSFTALSRYEKLWCLYHELCEKPNDAIDLTWMIYEKNAKGKVSLKKEFGVGCTGVSVPVTMHEITRSVHVRFSEDMLSRNAMKNIENLNPKVSLYLVKQSERVYTYLTLMRTDHGSLIQHSMFSSMVVF